MCNTGDKCAIADYCGGCAYQGVPYDIQLERKNAEIIALLAKHKVDEKVYEGIIPATLRKAYRNKMEYTFGDFEKGGALELGMHRKKHFMSIVTSDMCMLVPDDFNKVLRATLNFCRECGYSFYNKKNHLGLLRNLIVRRGVNSGELLIDIVTAPEGMVLVHSRSIEKSYGLDGEDNGRFDEAGFLKRIMGLNLAGTVVGVLHTINNSLSDAVIDCGTRTIFGRRFYKEEILGLKFKVSIFSFFQTNINAVERLYADALDLIPDIEDKVVYDLYCGTGTISQLMSSRAKSVYGIEIVEEAVESAVANTVLNGIENCHYICGDVKKKLEEPEERPDVIVVDPPRSGIQDKVVRMISSYEVPEILYISCNPKTLAINLEQFAWLGYRPKLIRAYDNFVMTRHVECIALIQRVKS